MLNEVPVTAADRFEKLGKGEIDVLCDPVTMRYSEEARTSAGNYSPIVFATGISYLRRSMTRGGSTIYVGYVSSSTAEEVAERACKIDLFNVVAVDERPGLERMCQTAKVVRDLERPALLKPEQQPGLDVKARDAALLKEARAAAKAEKAAVDERLEGAGENRRAGYDAAVKQWEGRIRHLNNCRENCAAGDMAKDFGDLCGATLTQQDEEQSAAEPKPQVSPWTPTQYRLCPFPDHTALVNWFCRLPKDTPQMVYLGDREIILGKLRTWNDQQPYRCPVQSETAASNLTYEPYALMTAAIQDRDLLPDTPQQRAMAREAVTRLVQRRVYEFFSFGSLARAKFDTYFRGPDDTESWTMSEPLAYLFLLNGTEEERLFTFPPEGPPGSAPN